MRTRPLVGTKPWFGPRRFGWGWGPASWHGWIVVAAFVVVQLSLGLVPGGARPRAAVASLLVLVGIVIVKGTSPGGPYEADKFDRVRGRRPRLAKGWRPPDEPSVTDIVNKPWPSDQE